LNKKTNEVKPMKKQLFIYTSLALMALSCLNAADTCDVNGTCTWTTVKHSSVATQNMSNHEITAKDLKNLMDSKTTMVILDARPSPYFDGNLIPGAKNVPYNAPEDQIKSVIPSKNTLVVTYCTNTQCPASGYLAERLMKLGYTNVKEFSGGIVDWIAAGYTK
jgi:rhodanese-related sulfurtransferase